MPYYEVNMLFKSEIKTLNDVFITIKRHAETVTELLAWLYNIFFPDMAKQELTLVYISSIIEE